MACPCCCTEPGACCVENFDFGYRSWTCSQKTWCACRDVGGWFRGPITCQQASCSSFEPCNYCCASLPASFNVAISGTVDQLVIGADNVQTFIPFGSRINVAQAIVYNKSVSANVTLTGDSAACRRYLFNGCGPFGDFISITVDLAQTHTQGRCRWRLSLQCLYQSCATYGNRSYTNCVTGEVGSFFQGGFLASETKEIEPTCALSGLTFSGTHLFLSEQCVNRLTFGGENICRTASIDGCAVSTVLGPLPQIQSAFTWTATIQ